MKTSSLVLLFAVSVLVLSVAAATTNVIYITIIHVTPESKVVDADGDGKVNLAECAAATRLLFPQESPSVQAGIATGCMMLLNAQQSSPEEVADIDSDFDTAQDSDTTAPTEQQQQRAYAQAFKDRIGQ
jgi:hypothetical protein